MIEENVLISYINGNNSELYAPEELKDETRQYLKENPLPEDMENLTQEQATAFSFLHNEYVKETPIIEEHIKWHNENGSGGTLGEGSGEEFLLFHQRMINDLSEYIGQEIPQWRDFDSDIVNKFPLANNVKLSPFYQKMPLKTPSYLQYNSSEPEFPTRPPEITSKGEQKTVNRLEDFESVDELGRVIGLSWHGELHGVLGAILLNFESPRAPQFYCLHQSIAKKTDEYLETQKGKQWYDGPNSENWKEYEDKSLSFTADTEITPRSSSPSQVPSYSPSQLSSESPSNLPSQLPSNLPSQAPATKLTVAEVGAISIGGTSGGALMLFLAAKACKFTANKIRGSWRDSIEEQRQNEQSVSLEGVLNIEI